MNDSYAMVKIHNGQRRDKLARKKVQTLQCTTPPKYLYKQSVWNIYDSLQTKLGYDYDVAKANNKLKWMKQQFKDKMTKYLGNSTFFKKTTRVDKVKLKEQLRFEVKVNPIKRHFTKIDSMIEDKLKLYGMRRLMQQ